MPVLAAPDNSNYIGNAEYSILLLRDPAGRNFVCHASEDMIWPKMLHIYSDIQSNLYNEHAYCLSVVY